MKRDYVALLAPDVTWQVAYPIVEADAREALHGITKEHPISTAALVVLLWPGQGPRTAAGKAAMKRMYRALAAIAAHDMRDCTMPGPVIARWGKQVRPMLWFTPAPMSDRLSWIKENDPEGYAAIVAHAAQRDENAPD